MSRRVALGAALLLASCRKPPPAPPEEPQQVLRDFALSQSYRGNPSWELKAPLALLRETAREAALSGPRMEFYKSRRIASRLSALSGILNTHTQEVRLTSSVVVTSLDDRSELRTEELSYSPQKRKFFTDREVFVRRPGGSLLGKGLEATADLSEIRIFHQRAVIEERKR